MILVTPFWPLILMLFVVTASCSKKNNVAEVNRSKRISDAATDIEFAELLAEAYEAGDYEPLEDIAHPDTPVELLSKFKKETILSFGGVKKNNVSYSFITLSEIDLDLDLNLPGWHDKQKLAYTSLIDGIVELTGEFQTEHDKFTTAYYIAYQRVNGKYCFASVDYATKIITAKPVWDIEINEIYDEWVLEDGFDPNVEIDNGEDRFVYKIPVQLHVKKELIFEDGRGSIEDWGLNIPEIKSRLSNLKIDKEGIVTDKLGVICGDGIFHHLVFYRCAGGIKLDLSLVVLNTNTRYEWGHVGTYKKLAESGRREILTPVPRTTGHTDLPSAMRK